MNYKHIALLIVILLVTLVVVGCGKKSDQDEDGVFINAYLPAKIKTLDPMSLRDVYGAKVAYHIFEQLYTFHYLKRPYVSVPLLAESMPEISEDKLTYTIRIKKGVMFQDDECFAGGKGREVTAHDFIFGIKRIANIKNVSENWAALNDNIVGLDDFREYTKTCKSEDEVDYSRGVEGLGAPDDYTLIIKLTKPWPNIIDGILTDSMTSPIAKEAYDHYGKEMVSHPIGTGPFILDKWHRGSYVKIVRNPNFRGDIYPTEGEPGDAEAGYLADAGEPIPFVDGVLFKIIQEQQPAWLLFMQGQIDAKSIPKDNWGDTIVSPGELTDEMKQLNIELITFVDPSTFWLGFNMEDAVLGNNKPLRQAISCGYDRQKYIDMFWNSRDMVAHGFVPPLINSYDPNISRYGFSEYNPDKAKALLTEAEKIHGGPIPTLTLTLPGTDTLSRLMADYARRQFEQIGLDVETELMDWPTFQQKTNKRQAQMFMYGISAGSTDALDILEMFYSKSKSPGPNKFNYENPEYDKLYQQAEVMFDSPERTQLYRQMELMALRDCPAVFVNHRVAYFVRHDWLLNYKPTVFGYGLARYYKVDIEKRLGYKELLKKVK